MERDSVYNMSTIHAADARWLADLYMYVELVAWPDKAKGDCFIAPKR